MEFLCQEIVKCVSLLISQAQQSCVVVLGYVFVLVHLFSKAVCMRKGLHEVRYRDENFPSVLDKLFTILQLQLRKTELSVKNRQGL